jgi:hypothetical protein
MLYSKSCIPTSHNSFASSSNKFIFWPNQHLSIKDQLEIGVRGFMLDLYTVQYQIVLRHGMMAAEGINKPVDGIDILFYDVFKEFTTFLEEKGNYQNCKTITIILESYVSNKETYLTLNQEGLATKYLYKKNPNLATLEEVCNKIIIFTSHTKDAAVGIHPPSLYKENHFKYYQHENYLDALVSGFAIEKCEERAEGRAKYIDKTVNFFCFNHFSPLSALIERAILIKPTIYLGKEAIDQVLEPLNVPYKLATSSQDPIKAFNTLESLIAHIDSCRSQDIKDSFFPTLIAVDFVEKDSGVFLCSNDSRCLYGIEYSSNSSGVYYHFIKLIGQATSLIYNNYTIDNQEL